MKDFDHQNHSKGFNWWHLRERDWFWSVEGVSDRLRCISVKIPSFAGNREINSKRVWKIMENIQRGYLYDEKVICENKLLKKILGHIVALKIAEKGLQCKNF